MCKITPHKCPECGWDAVALVESVLGDASITVDKRGNFDYDGETEMNWDSQGDGPDDVTYPTAACQQGHTWVVFVGKRPKKWKAGDKVSGWEIADKPEGMRRGRPCILFRGVNVFGTRFFVYAIRVTENKAGVQVAEWDPEGRFKDLSVFVGDGGPIRTVKIPGLTGEFVLSATPHCK